MIGRLQVFLYLVKFFCTFLKILLECAPQRNPKNGINMSTHATTIASLENMSTTVNETLSSRLLYALKRQKFSQSELARLIGVKPQIIQYLCTSSANKSKFAYEIATALGVNPNWLIAGKGPVFDLSSMSNTTSNQPKVPLLDWNNIIVWLNQESTHPQKADKYIFVTNDQSTRNFAIRIADTSMIPRFEIGTVLIIDPELKPNINDFVVAKISHQEQPVIRQLILKGNQHFLSPINSTIYKEIELKTEDNILGIVRQAYFEFTR